MKLTTTTSDFRRYTDDYFEQLTYVKEAGFRYIDLSLYTLKKDDPLFYQENWREYVGKIRNFAEDNGLSFVQAHGPNVNCIWEDPGSYEDAVWKSKRAIEICSMLDIPNVVIHAGYNEEVTDRDEWFEANRRFFAELFEDMDRFGVNVLVENGTKANAPYWYYLISGQDMIDFVKYVNHPRFHVCWDTGHANIEGPQYQQIMDLGEELYAIHFADNRGMQDEHIIPFMGTLNIDEVMHALKDVGFRGPLTFEAESVPRASSSWLGRRHEFPQDTRLLDAPLQLRREMERYLYMTGEYILKTYGCFEE